jgi:DNA-binding SARP family transcriptional activator
MLALLVAHRGRQVRQDLMIEEIWGGGPVSAATVRVTLRRLRERFEAVAGLDPVLSAPRGYQLNLPTGSIDSERFCSLVDEARTTRGHGDVRRSAALAREGLDLWAGDAFSDARDLPSVRSEAIRLEHVRLDAWELLAADLIDLGDLGGALAPLAAVIEADPYRESAWGLRILALYRAGQQRQALATHDEVRRLLVEGIGIEPGCDLVRLERSILDQEPAGELGFGPVAGRSMPEPDRHPRRAGSADGLPHPATRPIGRRSAEAHFVGRERHLGAVADLLEPDCATRVLVLEGSAGIGKTSLAIEAGRLARGRGRVVAWGACPRDVAAGMLPVAQILRALLDAHDHQDPLPPAARADLAAAFPELDVVGPAMTDPGPAPTPAPEPTRLRLYRAAETLLGSLPHPALVVVDDIQWISEAAAGLFAHLVEAVPAARWLIVTRTGDRSTGATRLLGDLAGARTGWLDLPPLTDAETMELVADRAGDRASRWTDVILERSGGHPFLTIELLRHLSTGGDPADTPRGVEALVAGEVTQLDAEAERLASVVAVAGRPYPTEALVTAAGLDPERSAAAVAAVRTAGLVQGDRDDSVLWPAHDLVRGALLAHLDGAGVRRVHGALAEALVPWDQAFPDLRFGHLLRCGRDTGVAALDELAVRVLSRLTRQAAPHLVVELGREYLARVGDTSSTRDGLEARLLIARALYAIGESSPAQRLVATVRTALEALDDPTLLADATLSRSFFAVSTDEALTAATDGLRVLDRLPADQWRRRADLAAWVGHQFLKVGRNDEARRVAHLAVAALGHPGDEGEAILVHGLEYQVAATIDSPPTAAVAAFATLADLAAETDDPTAHTALHLMALDQALRAGTLADHEREIEAAESLPLSLHRADIRWWSAAARAGLELARGHLEAGKQAYLHAMGVGAEHGIDVAMAIALLHRMLHDWDEGTLGAMHQMLPSEPMTGEPPLLIAQGLVYAEAGDLTGARVICDHLAAGSGALVVSSPTAWPLVASVGAELAWRTGHEDLARHLASRLAPHAGLGLSASGFAYLGAADRVLGLAAATVGRTDDALTHLEQAVAGDRHRGAPRWAARSARAAAEVLDRRADPGDAACAATMRSRAEVLDMSADTETTPIPGPGTPVT